MKLDKGAILASMAIIVLASVLAGAGTMAWFSTPSRSTGTYYLNAATMDMQITTQPITLSNLVPGQKLPDITIKISNTGTMDILYLCGSMELADGATLSENDIAWKFAKNIIVEEWWEYIPGSGWTNNVGGTQKYEELVGDGQAPLTLLEVAQSYARGRNEPWNSGKPDQFGKYKMYSSDWISGGGYDQTPGPAIIVGGEYQMVFRLKFSESAGNELQGQSLSFRITFQGLQDLSQRP
jgi:hypothetical protein